MTRPTAVRLFLGSLVLAVCAASAQDEAVTRVELPLENGKLALRDLVGAVARAVGVEAPEGLERLDWSFDARSVFASAPIEAVGRMTGGGVSVTVHEASVEIAIDRQKLAAEGESMRTAVAGWIDRLLADVPRPSKRPEAYGVTVVTPENQRAELDSVAEMEPKIVLLVHGLDDPGWMWRDVVPALEGAGHRVARFEYANDGPIADAGDLLAAWLRRLGARGVEHVDLVVHSMGGLVARDVLTRPAYYDGSGAGGGEYPRIGRLIMVGTPNHGSGIVRLRGISEIKDQLSRAISASDEWIGGLADGQGEAAEDLLPGSTFLERLNARPLATGVRYTIIAGRMSPLDENAIDGLGAALDTAATSAGAPKWLKYWLDTADREANGLLRGAVRGLGDGCVSIDSARLDGVDDFVVVEANHVSLIVNVPAGLDRTPPAIPLIIERLGAE